MEWDRSVETILADGYDVHYGARSIKYEVERRVINQLALAHERGIVKAGGTVQILVLWPTSEKDPPMIRLRVKDKDRKDFVDVESENLLLTSIGSQAV